MGRPGHQRVTVGWGGGWCFFCLNAFALRRVKSKNLSRTISHSIHVWCIYLHSIKTNQMLVNIPYMDSTGFIAKGKGLFSL